MKQFPARCPSQAAARPDASKTLVAQVAKANEIIRLSTTPAVLQYRAIAKLKSTYSDALPQLIDPATGRLHTSFHQALTATGRLSSTEPNLQNIPTRTEEGRRIRQAFIAPPGHVLMAADDLPRYSSVWRKQSARASAVWKSSPA